LHILNNQGREAAAQFLHQNRELRLSHHGKQEGSFIYTGSISLHHIVSLAADIKTVNDFDYIHVEPLLREEAIDMANKILKSSKRVVALEQLEHLVDRIEWLIPFHIKLVLKEILDLPLASDQEITMEVVQDAFDRLLHLKNRTYFSLYFSRLEETYQGKERQFVFKVLNLSLEM
jgi:Tfp pilus assembly protein PilN